MCVIMYVEDKRPTEDMVQRAWKRNSHGGGVAWREDGEVHWSKGLDEKDMQRLCRELPFPYVAHFRIASTNGGGISDPLCHPFPVDVNPSQALVGKTTGSVLFHNGDWGGWRIDMKDAALKTGIHIPYGRCSDSRAMAWLSAIFGIYFMDLLHGQKGVIFSPTGVEFFLGDEWSEVEGVWCSNDHFWERHKTFTATMCKEGTCTIAFNLDADGYCIRHRKPISPIIHGAMGTALTIVPKLNQGVENPVINIKAVVGGTRDNNPFAQVMKEEGDPDRRLKILMIAEQQQKDGKLSKNLLKSIRKWATKLTSTPTPTPTSTEVVH